MYMNIIQLYINYSKCAWTLYNYKSTTVNVHGHYTTIHQLQQMYMNIIQL